jgi:hypothetical protein
LITAASLPPAARLRAKIKPRWIVLELMPPRFTLVQLQRAVEALAGRRLHSIRLIEQPGLIEETGEKLHVPDPSASHQLCPWQQKSPRTKDLLFSAKRRAPFNAMLRAQLFWSTIGALKADET